MGNTTIVRTTLVLFLTVALVTTAFSGVAAAETRAEGTVVVEEGETVDSLTAIGGSVVVRGTVDGNLEGVAGSVVIEQTGVVRGDVSMTAGSVRIDGQIDGDVEVAAGSVSVTENAEIGGTLKAGTESVDIAGRIGGNAVLGAARVTLTDTATIDGNVRYDEDASFDDQGASIGGTVTAESSLSIGGFGIPRIPGWVFSGYAMAVNLVVGAILLLVVPGFSRRVTDTVEGEPLRSVGIGVLALFGVPIGLVLLALTIVGIPLTIVGAILFGLTAWFAVIYGRIAIGTWALAQADVDNRWLALFAGVVGLGLLGQIPVLGGLLTLATFLLGLGAIALSLIALRTERGGGEAETGTEPTERDSGEPGVAGP